MDWLQTYIGSVCEAKPICRQSLSDGPEQSATIVTAGADEATQLDIQFPKNLHKDEAYIIRTIYREKQPILLLASRTSGGLRQAMLHLLREMKQDGRELRIGPLNVDEEPWIPHREVLFLFCWASPTGDPRTDMAKFGVEKLNAYVDMMMSFGFNGVQVGDLEAAYKRLDANVNKGADINQAFIRNVADRAHANAGHCTDTVWAGQIGEQDQDYAAAVAKWLSGNKEGDEVDDPDLRRAYSRWYSRYARVADCVDRVICQWGEPWGRLPYKSVESNIKMQNFLTDHFTKKNPSITPGLCLWRSFGGHLTEGLEKSIKEKQFPTGHVFYEPGMPDEQPQIDLWPWADREKVRKLAAEAGYGSAVWSDYLEDMETDGLPFMSVNDLIIKEFYTEVRDRLDKINPTLYWSTLDGNHISNMFSQYVAARLLWNPYQDTNVLLKEITDGIWGPKNGRKVLDSLLLIRDARSGPSWKTYCWYAITRRVGTGDPQKDLERAQRSLTELREMRSDREFVPKLPLPLKPMEILEIITPNLEQIAMFAQNRIMVDKILARDRAGDAVNELLQLKKQVKPIPPMNTWSGTFGQLENLETQMLLQRLGQTRIANGAYSWKETSKQTELEAALYSTQHAFDGKLSTTWEICYSGIVRDRDRKFPVDLGYAWLEPRAVDRVIIDYLTAVFSPQTTDGVVIQYWDGKQWQPAEVKLTSSMPGKGKTFRVSYEISEVSTQRLRAYFTTPTKNGGFPKVSEMSFWRGEKKVGFEASSSTR